MNASDTGVAPVLIVCAIHWGLSISFLLQRWNARSRKARRHPDPLMVGQLTDSLLAVLVAVAALLAEDLQRHPLVAWALCGLVVLLIVRVVKRTAGVDRFD